MKKGYRTVLIVGMFALFASVVTVAAVGKPAGPSAQSVSSVSQTAEFSSPVQDVHYVQPGTHLLEVQVTPSEDSEKPDADWSAVAELVTRNRAFGDALYDDAALIDAAQIALLDRSVEIDGFRYVEKQTVNEFIYNLYGRRVDEAAGEIYGLEAPDGYYAILPRSFDLMSQTVTDVGEQEDGRLIVTTEVAVAGLDSTESFTAVTVLAPSETPCGYVIVSAEPAG